MVLLSCVFLLPEAFVRSLRGMLALKDLTVDPGPYGLWPDPSLLDKLTPDAAPGLQKITMQFRIGAVPSWLVAAVRRLRERWPQLTVKCEF